MNRTMEAKRLKYIRQSRARPRTLRMNSGHQRVPQSIDRSKIPLEYVGLFAYRERGKTFIDAFLEAKFPAHVNHREQFTTTDKERGLRTVLADGRFQKVVMFSDTRLTWFEFIEYLPVSRIIRHSISYGSYDRAIQVFQLNSIRWKEVIQLDVES